jgi:hypothetical protein
MGAKRICAHRKLCMKKVWESWIVDYIFRSFSLLVT